MTGNTDFRIERSAVAGQPRDQAAWLAIERIYDDLATPHEPDPRLDSLTEGQCALYVLHWVQSEIRNGGFAQLYYNATGMLAPRAPGAARLIGATDYAGVFEDANGIFPDGRVPIDHAERQAALARVVEVSGDALEDAVFDSDAFYAVEDRFFDLLNNEDIYELMGRFVEKRPADFFTDA